MTLKEILEYLEGKKTFIVAILAVAYGIYADNPELIFLGLGLAGVRDGIRNEVVKTIKKRK